MKRGSSGLSLVLGIDKPLGMTSHDVINSCRHIFRERRVGHAGTLDPLASGALLVCIGSATRLCSYFTKQDKSYRFTVIFGTATDTDDAAGHVVSRGSIPSEICDRSFVLEFLPGIIGRQKQIPPQYSAIKVQGKASYKAAREGIALDLQARDIEIYDAKLLTCGRLLDTDDVFWEIAVRVSKGTYIRSLARDIGDALGCPAHVGSLQRTKTGALSLDACIPLASLEKMTISAALDPVTLLGYRIVSAQEEKDFVANGRPLEVRSRKLFKNQTPFSKSTTSFGVGTLIEDVEPLAPRELVSVVADNKLVGLYRYDHNVQRLLAQCIFPMGVTRGDNCES